jgi:hypothetical protein
MNSLLLRIKLIDYALAELICTHIMHPCLHIHAHVHIHLYTADMKNSGNSITGEIHCAVSIMKFHIAVKRNALE